MSDNPPVPPLPPQPAEEAARTGGAPATTPTAAAYDPSADPDNTGVPTSLHGEVDDIGRGFVSALFDISFRTFITRRLASVFYLVGLIAIAIGFIVYLVSGIISGVSYLVNGNVGAGLSLIVATLILVPVIAMFSVIALRFVIEGVVALIAIAENTERTAENTGTSPR
ncbi:DUF4282 domain-containing protein [Microbacterium lacus]|uniref:DUF4282 domain-containing protein n=1 Tax=Microbacterium lacus TaxID=415217 RepID=UPI00384B31CC